MSSEEKKIYSVGEVTRRIKSILEERVGDIWVEGELSNVRRPSSGHYYFTIKDESAQLSGVLFRGNQRGLKFELEDGMQVRCFGSVTVYERYGNYQIIVRQIEESGKGALQARFEKLKEKLQKEGLFEKKRKKRLPLLPQHIGIVTSPTGAAIRDILNVIGRRFPNVHIVLAPVRVQGDEAAGEIAEAIEQLNRKGGLDALIVGRGGGSLEDLWAFNEEIVARAIEKSAVPVISAVGHEIDFTISDFVADLRAATPSAAAELVVGRREDFEDSLTELGRRLVRSCKEAVLVARNRLLEVEGSAVFNEPINLVRQYTQRIDGLEMRMRSEIQGVARDTRQRVDGLSVRLQHRVRLWSQARAERLKRVETHLNAISPLAVLDRGYSITRDKEGRIIRSADSTKKGQDISTRVAKGEFKSTVK